MPEIEILRKERVQVRYLAARCGVRYWEDATVNGVEDSNGSLIPCRDGDDWAPLIDIDAGRIIDWPAGTVADLHYKVCDDGTYQLRDEDNIGVRRISGYVPSIMCPEGDGYGDYVKMKIDGEGRIANWKANDLQAFLSDNAEAKRDE